MHLFQMLVNIYDYADDQTIYVIEPWLLEPIYTLELKEPKKGLYKLNMTIRF